MKLEQLKSKLDFVKKAGKYKPILGLVKVELDGLVFSDLDTSVKIKNNYDLQSGLQSIDTLGLLPSDKSLLDDYPTIDFDSNPSEAEHVQLNRKVIEDLLKYTSKDETRLHLNCICIDKDNIVATDGHILKAQELERHTGESYLLPNWSLKILMRFLKAYRVKNFVVKCEEGHAIVDNEHFTIRMRTLSRQYPNWRVIVPEKFKGRFTIDNWIDLKENKALFKKESGACILEGNGTNVILSSQLHPEKTWNVGYTDHKFKIAFNVNLFDIAANKTKFFDVEYNKATAPVLVNEAIVMPLKL